MRRLVSVLSLGCAVLLVLLGAAAPAAAQDEPGSKDHPMVPRINANYQISSYDATDFDSADFPLPADKVAKVEGKHWLIWYAVKDAAVKSSPLGIVRNYQNAFRAKGGTVLHTEGTSETTLQLKTATGE